MQRDVEWLDPSGEVDDGGPAGRDDLRAKDRVGEPSTSFPLEDVSGFWALLDTKPSRRWLGKRF